jgi:hypothetical protein
MQRDIIDSGVDIGLKANEFFNAIAYIEPTRDPNTGEYLDSEPYVHVREVEDYPGPGVVLNEPAYIETDRPIVPDDPIRITELADEPPSSGLTVDEQTSGSSTQTNTVNIEIPPVAVVTASNIFGDSLSETQQVIPLSGGGGGGGGGFGDIIEPSVASDGGYVQKVSGISVTGWVYPYPFLAITLAGGGIGYLVAKKFNQAMVGMLALIAAGLMAGSAIGMKIKPPVKKI